MRYTDAVRLVKTAAGETKAHAVTYAYDTPERAQQRHEEILADLDSGSKIDAEARQR